MMPPNAVGIAQLNLIVFIEYSYGKVHIQQLKKLHFVFGWNVLGFFYNLGVMH